jgi:O-antigen/teichoic acid export membrane protein
LQKLTRLASDTAIYGLGTIVPRLINYFLVIPHTRVFAPADYGVITNLYAYAGFLNVIFLFGMETAFFRFVSKPGASADQVFRLAQTVVMAVSGTLALLMAALAMPLANAWGLNGKTEYVYYLAGILFVDAAVAIPFARWRQEGRALIFSLSKIGHVLLLVSLNYYFLYYRFDPAVGVGYVFIANLLANTLLLAVQAGQLLRWRPLWQRPVSGQMVRYAYPLMLMGLAGMTYELFSRVSIQWWWPENFQGQSARHALGVFGACYKFAVFMSLAVMAFRYAAEPFFFSNAADKQSAALFARVNHYFVVAGAFIVLAVTVNLGWLKWMLGNAAYHEGLDVVLILLMAYLFNGVYYNFSVWFKITDRTHFGMWFTAGGAAITVAGNYLLIPVAGYYGSAWVTLAASVAMTLACYILGQRYHPIPYPVLKSAAYVALAGALIYISHQVNLSAPLQTFFNLALCALYALIAWLAERKEFLRMAH